MLEQGWRVKVEGQGEEEKDDTLGQDRPKFDAKALDRRLKSHALTGLDDVCSEYVSSTIVAEAEDGHIACVEDVYGVIQTFVPEDMLGIEDDDDMETLVAKVWAALEKVGAVRPDSDDDVEMEIGGCELCGRDMPLTKHHLMPRSTHKKYLKQGVPLSVLQTCADICRPCHSAVHRSYDNDALAASYNTVAKLQADEKVSRFIKWAQKQRVTARADALNPKLHYRR